jgi:hypothetical protein
MKDSDACSQNALTTGNWWTRRIGTSNARDLRNSDDYDDWEYGTEPIPSDTSWVRPTTLTQLFHKIIAKLELADTVDSQKLARLVINEILRLPASTLLDLKSQDPSFNDPNSN